MTKRKLMSENLKEEIAENEVYFIFNNKQSLIDRFIVNLGVLPVDERARTVLINFRGDNPRICHDVTLAVANTFINYSNKCPTTNYAEGFSIFVSKKNIEYEKSLEYAKIFAEELISRGLVPTLHHAEKIKGENRELIDRKLGIYLFDDLKVLKNANSPAFLFEAGVIVNPNEEKKVKTKVFKDNITEAVMKLLN